MKPTAVPPKNDAWILRSRDLLQRTVENPDPPLQRRLQSVRRQAIEAARPRVRIGPAGLVGAFATAALALGLATWHTQPSLPGLDPLGPALRADTPLEQALTLSPDDFELILGEEDYQLLEELEFYAWLESTPRGR